METQKESKNKKLTDYAYSEPGLLKAENTDEAHAHVGGWNGLPD